MPERFFEKGLHFSCTRCSACCRHESGFVFLSKQDVDALATELSMTYSNFVETYCRWIPIGDACDQLSLKEKFNFDCIFWKEGCTVYKARPLQCRVFPFWASVLADKEAWDATAADCPGMNHGDFHDASSIQERLDRRAEEELIVRHRH